MDREVCARIEMVLYKSGELDLAMTGPRMHLAHLLSAGSVMMMERIGNRLPSDQSLSEWHDVLQTTRDVIRECGPNLDAGMMEILGLLDYALTKGEMDLD